MKTFRALFLGLALTSIVAPAYAEDAKPPATPIAPAKDARLVPVLKDGKFAGIKVYAIKPGGRFDQAKFQNGDTVEKIDGVPLADDGGRALHEKVIEGKADATVTVRRRGKAVELKSKAIATAK
jgi:type II secretory pathway component PulC